MKNITLRDIAQTLAGAGVLDEPAAPNVVAALPVTGTACDSRAVVAGDLFVCKGAAFRPEFLAKALEAGAVAYLCDREHADGLAAIAPGVPALVASDLRPSMALASAAAFGRPDRDLPAIGITGTKGKTTTAYMLRSIVETARGDGSCGIIGTIETYDGRAKAPSHNTTPEPPDLWRHLANARDAHLAAMVMEVSSQALKYDRTLGVGLAAGCFLNIGLDHISAVEHADFEDYFTSKLRIFSQCETAVVNLESDHAERVLEAAARAPRVRTFGVRRPDADAWAEDLATSERGVSFTLCLATPDGSPAEKTHVDLPFPGEFSVSNALCAALVARRILGIDAPTIARGLARTQVPGRMEFHRSNDGQLTAIVDYAHNRLSFDALLSGVREAYPSARMIAVFGAVGGKALERRHDLPEIAARYVDHIVLTADDPWTEDPADICREMERSLPEGFPHDVVIDREQATERAFALAEQHIDAGGRAVVLLLAKGHETYQHTKAGFEPCPSDCELAARGVAAHDAATVA